MDVADHGTQSSHEDLLLLLVLLRHLGPIQGARIVRNDDTGTAEEPKAIRKGRRDYLQNLALLCDYNKGGDTVAAIAIEQAVSGLVYHLASPCDPNARTTDFLKEVIDLLASTDKSTTDICDQLLRRSISFNRRTIKKRSSLLCRAVDRCILQLSQVAQIEAESSSLQSVILHVLGKLKCLMAQGDHHALCAFACQQINSSFITTLYRAASRMSDNPVVDPNNHKMDEVQSIRHHLGRLAAYRLAVRQIVHMTRFHPSLLENVTIRGHGGSDSQRMPITRAYDVSVDSIIRLLAVTDPETEAALRQVLSTTRDDIPGLMQGSLEEDFQPRIHAELILLEAMWKEKCEFFAGDRFIACSKPACFCCYHYIRLHPIGLALPPTHNKSYRNWSSPSESNSSHLRHEVTRNSAMQNLPLQLKTVLRSTAIEKLLGHDRAFERRFDSTTGASSSRPTIALTESHDSFGTLESTFEPTDVRFLSRASSARRGLENVLMNFVAGFTLVKIIITIYVAALITNLNLPIPFWICGLLLLAACLQIATLYSIYTGRQSIKDFTTYVPMWLVSTVDVIVMIQSKSSHDTLALTLESTWQHWFRDKDDGPVRRLQDRLKCCGLRSTVDRAWPFPDATHNVDACLQVHGRTNSCFAPIVSRMRSCLFLLVALAVVDLFLKIILSAWTLISVKGKNRDEPRVQSTPLSRAFLEARREEAESLLSYHD